MDVTPTREVQTATLVGALVGAAAWLAAELGWVLPTEVVGAVTTLAVGAVAWFTSSAKVAAGTLATALSTLAAWVLDAGGVEVPPDRAALLNTLALFVFAWVASEQTDDGIVHDRAPDAT